MTGEVRARSRGFDERRPDRGEPRCSTTSAETNSRTGDLFDTRTTTADIADSATELARTPARPYEVLVALEKEPQRQLAEPLEH